MIDVKKIHLGGLNAYCGCRCEYCAHVCKTPSSDIMALLYQFIMRNINV